MGFAATAGGGNARVLSGRGYVPAGESYLLCSLAGGCRRKQEVETSTSTTRYATTLVASHIPVIPHHTAVGESCLVLNNIP